MILSFVIALSLLPGGHGFLFGGPDWNDLRVTWGVRPLSSNFDQMPRTEVQARSWGFTKFSDCTSNPQLRGNRYMKDGDSAVILIYDTNGYIAGIQAGIPKDLSGSQYPPNTLKPPFIDDGDQWVITAYFVDPSIICREGRSISQYESQGTGTNLYLQNGTDPERDSVLIPRRQRDIGNTGWVNGRCFYSMGQHYWHNATEDMSCDHTFPAFLLYNRGKLNGFGWAFQTGLTSTRYEHPTTNVLGRFFRPVPDCLKDVPHFSTLHIYMTRFPRLNFC